MAESFPGNAVRVRLGSAACDVREVATDFPRDQERPAPRNLWPRLPRLWVSGNHALPQLLARLGAGLEASSLRQEELGALLAQRADLASATGLIGERVEVEGNHVFVTGEEPAAFGFVLDDPASSTEAAQKVVGLLKP